LCRILIALRPSISGKSCTFLVVRVLFSLLMIEKLRFLFATFVLGGGELSNRVCSLLVAIACTQIEIHYQILIHVGFRRELISTPLRLCTAIVLRVRIGQIVMRRSLLYWLLTLVHFLRVFNLAFL